MPSEMFTVLSNLDRWYTLNFPKMQIFIYVFIILPYFIGFIWIIRAAWIDAI